MVEQILPDIPRAYTAVAEWGACLVYILIMRRRLSWVPLVVVLAGFLAALVGVQLFAGTLPLPFWTAGMLAAVAVMFLLLRTTLAGSPAATAYLTARAFVLAELVASLHWQLQVFFAPQEPGDAWSTAAHVLFAGGVYAAGFSAAWLVEARHMPRGGILDVGWREVVGATAITVATFAMSNLSFVNANTPFSGRLGPEIFYIRTLVDLCGYIALYAQQEWRREVRARAESHAMQALLDSQRDQYLTTKRAIDEVARRHHDMTHAIQAIRAEADPELRSRLVDDLEQSIQGPGTRFRTGSQVLDTVLQAKALSAREHGIEIACVADGALLEFMQPLDVVTIVGNALDNAIESAGRLEDPELRSVRLALFAQESFVMLRVENSYDGVVRRENGRILTRKAEAGHGFGLTSIERTVEEYGGSVSITSDDGWFSLRLLFPRAA